MQWSPHRGLTVTVPTGTKSGHILSFWDGFQFVPYKMVLILITGISDLHRFGNKSFFIANLGIKKSLYVSDINTSTTLQYLR